MLVLFYDDFCSMISGYWLFLFSGLSSYSLANIYFFFYFNTANFIFFFYSSLTFSVYKSCLIFAA